MSWGDYGRLRLDSYGQKPQSVVGRTEFDRGPAKQSRRSNLQAIHHSLVVDFSADEYANWLTWYRDTVNRGADWFAWLDPQDGATKDAQILNGLYEADPYSEQTGGPLAWSVSFVLVTME